MVEIIQSRSNSRVKLIRKLQQKHTRQKTGMLLLEGRRLVQDAVKSGLKIHFVGFTSSFLASEEGQSYYQLLTKQGIEVVAFADTIWLDLADTVTPQAVFAVAEGLKSSWSSLKDARRLLILNRVQDPGNMGTIIRTADAFGLDAVVLTKGCCDVTNPKVLRSAMASSFHIPIIEQHNNEELISYLKKQHISLYVTALRHTSLSLPAVKPTERWAVVMGNEGGGVEPFWLTQATETVFIPMTGKAESLNVSVATAIVLYQLCCITG